MALIPRIVAGTARLGFFLPDALAGRSRREAELRTLDALVEAGCSAFDLAASYQLGGTERLVGHWLASRGLRQKLFLVGKGGHPYPGLRPNRLTPEALSADLDASLRRLRIDRFDLYLLHRDFPGAPLEPIVETLAAADRAGRSGPGASRTGPSPASRPSLRWHSRRGFLRWPPAVHTSRSWTGCVLHGPAR